MAHVIQGRWFWHKSKARMGLPIGPQLPHFSDIRPFVRWKSLCLTFCSCWVLGGGSSWLTGSFAWRLYCCTELSCVLFHSIHSIHCRSVVPTQLVVRVFMRVFLRSRLRDVALPQPVWSSSSPAMRNDARRVAQRQTMTLSGWRLAPLILTHHESK